ncbi:hypothetical protein ATK36_3786 [Amycolatopsis sulphurea]|uniref:Uncharacterized protein n=2 Tax=Amycolatopsis sulphurea TaxID=76022 RepID=A0A2A9FBF5_9PSEU|nr:hypothetical protein ATK36_3786 [Amycolatopsis sulphurea]
MYAYADELVKRLEKALGIAEASDEQATSDVTNAGAQGGGVRTVTRRTLIAVLARLWPDVPVRETSCTSKSSGPPSSIRLRSWLTYLNLPGDHSGIRGGTDHLVFSVMDKLPLISRKLPGLRARAALPNKTASMAAAVSHPATVRTIGEANTLAGRAAKITRPRH